MLFLAALPQSNRCLERWPSLSDSFLWMQHLLLNIFLFIHIPSPSCYSKFFYSSSLDQWDSDSVVHSIHQSFSSLIIPPGGAINWEAFIIASIYFIKSYRFDRNLVHCIHRPYIRFWSALHWTFSIGTVPHCLVVFEFIFHDFHCENWTFIGNVHSSDIWYILCFIEFPIFLPPPLLRPVMVGSGANDQLSSTTAQVVVR